MPSHKVKNPFSIKHNEQASFLNVYFSGFIRSYFKTDDPYSVLENSAGKAPFYYVLFDTTKKNGDLSKVNEYAKYIAKLIKSKNLPESAKLICLHSSVYYLFVLDYGGKLIAFDSSGRPKHESSKGVSPPKYRPTKAL